MPQLADSQLGLDKYQQSKYKTFLDGVASIMGEKRVRN